MASGATARNSQSARVHTARDISPKPTYYYIFLSGASAKKVQAKPKSQKCGLSRLDPKVETPAKRDFGTILALPTRVEQAQTKFEKQVEQVQPEFGEQIFELAELDVFKKNWMEPA